jgi:phosphonate transport system substrate-binding protein
MADLGVRRVKVLMARNNRQMIKYLRQGRVDWVTETVMSAAIFQREAGAELLLLKRKKGVPDYHSVFFVRKDSNIAGLDDLKGRTLALEDPGSTTAYFIPAKILLDRGLEPVELDSPREEPPPDKVGFVFAREEINISTLVHKGIVDAGAFNNLDWEKDDHLPHIFQRDMRIIHRSGELPRAVEMVRGDLDPRLKARLQTLLLQAHEDPEAQTALRAYQQTSRFEPLSREQREYIDALYGTVRQVRERLE